MSEQERSGPLRGFHVEDQGGFSRLLGALEATGARGWALLTGTGFGPPRLLLDADEVLSLPTGFTSADASALIGAITPPSGPTERLFLLGYEAAASQCVDAPWHAHDPALGPAGFVRDFGSSLVFPEAQPARSVGHGPELRELTSALEARTAFRPRAAPRLWLTTQPGERERHIKRVQRCREELAAGVLYQANLAHRLGVSVAYDRGERSRVLMWFAAVLDRGAPPFAAVVDIPGWGLLLSLSPERFVGWDLTERTATAWPVKGTRPRGADPAADEALAAELLASVKDQAEHVMIVDLLRNDLGKVAARGGVTVSALMRALRASNVHHLESTIDAALRPDVGLPELLRATAPGGSITGAPKSTALEVIHALEGAPRGAYTGNLGVVNAAGRGTASILIRTLLQPDEGEGALHVGGGIVVGSDPEAEWQETLDKAAVFGRVTVA